MKVHHRACRASVGVNKDICGANCSQLLPQPIQWIVTACATYWTHGTAVCVLMEVLTHLWLPTTLPTLLPPAHTLIHVICDITVTVKKVA